MSDARLVIVVDVTGDPKDEDPHDVADELLAHAVDLGYRYSDGRKVHFVSAEWAGATDESER